MTLDLSQIEFEYDFFQTSLPDGSTLIINKIDEDFIATDGSETVLNRYNIVVATEDENIRCSSVIGTSNNYFSLNSNYTEVQGKLLDSTNISKCYMELAENE